MLIGPLSGARALARRLSSSLGAEVVLLEQGRFPDGETRLRFTRDIAGKTVILAAALERPDAKLFPLLLAAATARDLGARQVGLVAPYLPYMRQDTRFEPGAAISAVYLARLLSRDIDWLVTVDPHLHRIKRLADVFAVPAIAASSAPLLADWIKANLQNPVLIGPDSESAQWVRVVAERVGAPYRVLAKRRLGDRRVEISVPDLGEVAGRLPVLVDDIVSTGQTMMTAAAHLAGQGLQRPVCVAVHALFARGAYSAMTAAFAAIVTTNTVRHPSNAIDVSALLATEVCALTADGRSPAEAKTV